MDKESTTFGLNPEKLARLLKIGSDISQTDEKIDPEHKKAELLHDWLAATLPLDAALAEQLPIVIRRLCKELQPLSGEPFGKLLEDSKTNVEVLNKIKGYSKKLVTAAKSEAENDAATVVYYAAIASALFFHDQKITRFSYKDLEQSFSCLVKNSWIPMDLINLFEKASLLCKKKL
jgi:hypothetical protein